MRGWKRVKECVLCSCPRCVVRADRKDMGYCYRYQTTFFVKKDGRIVTAKGINTGTVLKGMASAGETFTKSFPQERQGAFTGFEYDWPMESLKEELPLWKESGLVEQE